jgi:hypothetical protein
VFGQEVESDLEAEVHEGDEPAMEYGQSPEDEGNHEEHEPLAVAGRCPLRPALGGLEDEQREGDAHASYRYSYLEIV